MNLDLSDLHRAVVDVLAVGAAVFALHVVAAGIRWVRSALDGGPVTYSDSGFDAES